MNSAARRRRYLAMSESGRIYLDNAATSWPKPQSVYAAVERAMREVGAPAGRGVYREADEAARLVADARRRVAALLGAEEPRRVAFTLNGTDSLNLAIYGLLKPGDHVVTTVIEHNSVLRPLRRLEQTGGVTVTRVPCDGEGIIDPQEMAKAVSRQTRLIALIHASNVTGALQPIEEVGRVAREREVLFLVDAAQTVGRVPLDVRNIGCSLLAAPGHKGLMGPLGTGVLYIAPGIEQQLASVRQGGTGTQSEEDLQPETLPDKYEAGNLNVPALAGLAAGAAWLQEQGLEEVHRRVSDLTTRLVQGFREIDGVTVFGPAEPGRRIDVVSIVIVGCQPHEAAVMLDTAHRIQTRPGLHCAPLMHRALGTIEGGGTLRFSVGPFNTEEEIDQTVNAVAEIAAISEV
jgi:cysteine desulfurase family protein